MYATYSTPFHPNLNPPPHPLVVVEGQVILCCESELPPTYSPTCHIQRIKTWLISLLNVSLRFEIRFKLYTDHKISLAGSYTRPWGTGWKKKGGQCFLKLITKWFLNTKWDGYLSAVSQNVDKIHCKCLNLCLKYISEWQINICLTSSPKRLWRNTKWI